MISKFLEEFTKTLEHLHFANPAWLWAAAAIPLVWLLFFLFYRPYHPVKKLEQWIDAHLLPFLLIGNQGGKRSYVKSLLLWSFIWACLTLALAGPRWSFREIEVFSKDQSLVILLDLSESMNAKDIKPSRLVRAKQKIEDLLNESKGLKIGLIAFAADPHMIAPITDDKETIRHLLTSLETDLFFIQGSNLSPALEMASTMLESEPGTNKALLIISDGEFDGGGELVAAKKIADKGIFIHTLGIGTPEGTLLQDKQGNTIKNHGTPILSKLVKNRLEEISRIGKGKYSEGHYGDGEIAVLKQLSDHAQAMEAGKKNRLWDEGFYFLIIPALPFFLLWFRRGTMFLIPLMVFFPLFGLQANWEDIGKHYFMNSEELGKQAMDDAVFETAAQTFQDPYRKGVAYYRAGDFAEAETMFRQSSRPEVAADADYNLGNALVKQGKFKEAITTYEDVLKKWPDHIKAKENLELVKKMLEQQKQQQDQQQQDKNTQDQKDQPNQEKEKERKNSENQENQSDPSQDNQENSSEESENNNLNGENHSQNPENKKNHSSEKNPQQPEKDEDQFEDRDEEKSDQQEQANAQLEKEFTENQQEGQKEGQEMKALKSQEDQDADAWLNLLSNDPKDFLKKKFYIESKKNGTKEGINPW